MMSLHMLVRRLLWWVALLGHSSIMLTLDRILAQRDADLAARQIKR